MLNKDISDQELIELLKTGNYHYFSLFTNRYEKYILSRCKTYVKDEDIAEDLCQEILIRVFLQLPKFRNEAKVTTWLYAIIHNTCIDFLRKNKKQLKQIITAQIVDEFADISDHDDELPKEKSIELLAELLEEMIPEEKLLLLLKYKEKQSITDISLSMGLTESAIKMRLKRAKERLNKLYESKLKIK